MKYGKYAMALAKIVFKPVISWGKDFLGKTRHPRIRWMFCAIGRRAFGLRSWVKKKLPNAFPREAKDFTMDEPKLVDYGVKTIFLLALYGVAIALPSLELRKSLKETLKEQEEAKRVQSDIAALNHALNVMKQEIEAMHLNNLQFDKEVFTSQKIAEKSLYNADLRLARVHSQLQKLSTPSHEPTI